MMCYALCCCRELFNNVACEAYFSDAGALQLLIDLQALLSVFQRYTDRPASYFRELGDAVKLLNLPQSQSEFVRQVSGRQCGAQNRSDRFLPRKVMSWVSGSPHLHGWHLL
jgi:hypothetical protein